jgi:hypothetical protein
MAQFGCRLGVCFRDRAGGREATGDGGGSSAGSVGHAETWGVRGREQLRRAPAFGAMMVHCCILGARIMRIMDTHRARFCIALD